MNKERLLNAAKACRETYVPGEFDMAHWGTCGTPGCAFGNYAFREDLQDEFSLGNGMILYRDKTMIMITMIYAKIGSHFELDDDQTREIFGLSGCENAQTHLDAAEYIEAFVQHDGQIPVHVMSDLFAAREARLERNDV